MSAAWQLGAFSQWRLKFCTYTQTRDERERGKETERESRERKRARDWQLLGGFSSGLFLRVLWSRSWDVRHANATANYATVWNWPATHKYTQIHTAAPQRQTHWPMQIHQKLSISTSVPSKLHFCPALIYNRYGAVQLRPAVVCD